MRNRTIGDTSLKKTSGMNYRKVTWKHHCAFKFNNKDITPSDGAHGKAESHIGEKW